MTIKHDDFTITDLESELVVDKQCSTILQQFHQQLLKDDIDPFEAGQLALGADYFLRDFIIGDRHLNIFTIDPDCVKQFAGHWYIIKNLEPNIKELTSLLQGIGVFYTYLLQQELITSTLNDHIQTATLDLPFYHQRIEQFLDITGDGYLCWCKECPLPRLE
ncbi:MAG: hypothetical protein U9R29_03325 [Thermodesulfobacteriota bacterium]|nr:hypothetical protein [Thermodesulfobacteriota bacterium]